MKINYTTFGSWPKKVLYDCSVLNEYKMEYDIINKDNDYTFYMLEPNQFKSFFKHDIFNNVSFSKLNKEYKKNEKLREYYNSIIELCKKEWINHIKFHNTWMYWHPDFILQLKDNWKRVVALWTADDDYWRINYCSLPYTKYYDYHFHVGVMFDKNWKTIADRLREEWGNPIRIPLWARLDHIRKSKGGGERFRYCLYLKYKPEKAI